MNYHAQLISKFYLYFKYYAPRKMTISYLFSGIQGPNKRFDKFA